MQYENERKDLKKIWTDPDCEQFAKKALYSTSRAGWRNEGRTRALSLSQGLRLRLRSSVGDCMCPSQNIENACSWHGIRAWKHVRAIKTLNKQTFKQMFDAVVRDSMFPSFCILIGKPAIQRSGSCFNNPSFIYPIRDRLAPLACGFGR